MRDRRKNLAAFSAKRAAAVVQAAEQVEDPIKASLSPCEYQKNHFVARLEAATSGTVSANQLDWAVQLVESNLRPMYEEVWGWDAHRKREELAHKKARFIFANAAGTAEPLGFLNYRWEEDPPPETRGSNERVRAVVYVYDLQLVPHAQGHGLGSHLMALLTSWAKTYGFEKIMLTCFKANKGAYAMYRKLGFKLDESSPDPVLDPDLKGYDILSKRL